MKNIPLTKLEINALLSMAGNLEDEMEDYFSFLGKRKLSAFKKAYYSAKLKLTNASK